MKVLCGTEVTERGRDNGGHVGLGDSRELDLRAGSEDLLAVVSRVG